jgi:SWI/SNF-related matrix-associated actin-dependent regulator 1 of chromatin subfamily A
MQIYEGVVNGKTTWYAKTQYSEREIPKRAGWRWDADAGRWWTNDPAKAAALAEYADCGIREKLLQLREQHKRNLEASRAADADVDVVIPAGLELRPYQRAGVAWLISHHHALLGDEMGLGKTIQVLAAVNTLRLRRVLVVCPKTLVLNWHSEASRWLTELKPYIFRNGGGDGGFLSGDGFYIVNYEKLSKIDYDGELDCLVVDESHYIKNPKAQRSKRVEQLAGRAKRVWLLTGTPIPNRPIELFHPLKILRHPLAENWFYFAKRYCDAYQGEWGWVVDGAANLDELQEKLRSTVMIRRKKQDVLTELPAKVRQVVVLNADGYRDALADELGAWQWYEDALVQYQAKVELARAEGEEAYAKAVAELRDAARHAFEEISRARHHLALAKVDDVVEHVKDIAEQHKVVVFAHHHDVIDKIAEALSEFGCVVVDGRVPAEQRHERIQRFQNDPTCRVYIGSITASGVGVTLTAASHVVFAELDWVPGNITQAEDRLHRIGQKDTVFVQHLVVDGSLDARMAKVLVEKQRVADEALDAEKPALLAEPVLPVGSAPTASEADDDSKYRKPTQLQAVGMTIAVSDREILHIGLRVLAGQCDGAVARDDTGFNKVDTIVGKALAAIPAANWTDGQAGLAAVLCNRYRRQLELVGLSDAVTVARSALESAKIDKDHRGGGDK